MTASKDLKPHRVGVVLGWVVYHCPVRGRALDGKGLRSLASE